MLTRQGAEKVVENVDGLVDAMTRDYPEIDHDTLRRALADVVMEVCERQGGRPLPEVRQRLGLPSHNRHDRPQSRGQGR